MNYRALTIPVVIIAMSIGYALKSPQTSAQANMDSPQMISKSIGDTSETSLDWNGLYKGVLPCADCLGIAKTIILNNDYTYTMKTQYLGTQARESKTQGKFTWNDAGTTITLDNVKNEPSQYFVGENMLIQLDRKGNRITGKEGEKYILTKTIASSSDQLTDIRWQLTEIMGQSVNKEDIYLQLNQDNTINGYDGCNVFSGNYEISKGNRIKFTQMLATMRACPELGNEGKLMSMLQKADNYTIKDGVLSINKARMAPLLRFKATTNQ